MTHTLHIDFETRSTVDLKKSGVYRYAEDKNTGIWCMSWRVERDDTHEVTAEGRWNLGEAFPEIVISHVQNGFPVVNHNATFERTIWNYVLRRLHPHVPPLEITQQDDTMARAAALGLPLSLDQLALAMKLPIRKDADGHAVMMKLCKPRSTAPDGSPIWHTDANLIERQGEYCDWDVAVESTIDRGLFPLSKQERRIWQLDQVINDRGVAVDVALVRKAIDVVMDATALADTRMWYLTDGDVQKCSQVSRLVKWLNDERGIPCESVSKGDIEDLLVGAQIYADKEAEEAVMLRRAAGKASVGKYVAIDRSVCADGRVRGSLQYHGASTGRWAGRGIQPQNFPRVDADRDAPAVSAALDLLGSDMRASEIVECLELLLGDGKTPKTLDILSKCLRAMIIAPEGKKLVGGDFSNVEGRVNAWLAGESWKLKAFEAYDAGEGPDLYKLAYASSFNKPHEDVSKQERQVGKVQELALGYQGAVGAYMNMAANYGIKPWEIANVARAASSDAVWKEAETRFEDANSYGLDKKTWTGLSIVVRSWRDANSRIMQGWWDLQDAAIGAVGTPGDIFPVYDGRVRYLARNGFLWCSLPSGRVIAYAHPRLVETTSAKGQRRIAVEYDGVDSKTKRWGPQRLYGGEQCNHVVQGTARDLMSDAMLRAEDEGFTTVLTVHDELLCEEPQNGNTSAAKLQRIMSTKAPWAVGLPLAAATWEDVRYVK